MKIVLICALLIMKSCLVNSNTIEPLKYLQRVNDEHLKLANKNHLASWNYESNITEHNLNLSVVADVEFAKFLKREWHNVKTIDWQKLNDENLKRQFKEYSKLGQAALSDDKYKLLVELIAEMKSIYSTAKICNLNNTCQLSLEPELTEILTNSHDPNELKHIWIEWRRATGKKMRQMYPKYVELLNEAAQLNNFSDYSEFLLDEFETPNIREQFEQLWRELEPYYKQIHAYVRSELRKIYGDSIVSEKGPIPAHLLGNMWAQNWVNIAKSTKPFANKQLDDITKEMQLQGFTPLKMFKIAENFFLSLNLTAMPESFWKNSIIEKPHDREIVCHASAWDMFDGNDFRIKQCTSVNQEDFSVVHHEMGHIQYYLQYKHQPAVFRSGANSGFHEAIGDVMSLSVETQKHLHKIGLIKSKLNENDLEMNLNHLYTTALDKIPFLPFGYLIDLYRWDIYAHKIQPHQYNCHWWKLRQQYQGVEPPVDRTSDDFDPGAKYHIPADVPYIRYFISYIIQFQFHKALCEKAGQYVWNDPTKPLYQCDIYQSHEAGYLLKQVLQMGSSRPWPDAMEVITGQRTMSAQGLIEYFKPILDYISTKNQENNVFIGWEPSTKNFGC